MHVGNFATFHRTDSILRAPRSSPPMMSLTEPSGLLLLALRFHLEFPLYSQWDTNIFLSRCCADFRIFSETGISGMEFEHPHPSNADVCKYFFSLLGINKYDA